MTDFLVTFGSNASAVIAQMRALEAQALRTQQVINQTNAASARTAAAGGGPAALGGLSAATVGAVSPQVDRLTRSLGGLQSQMRALSAIGLSPTLAQTRREATLLQQIVAAGGPAFGSYKTGVLNATQAVGNISPAAQASARDLIQQRAALDSTSQAFQRHVGRIQETVLVYAALAAAAAGVTSAVSLAATIDTESRRLEAVLGLNEAQGRDFISGIFQTAISTATPAEELLSEADLVASAFAGMADEAEKTRLSQELLNDVGKITTVTQRDVATETQNLIAIMQLGGLTVDQLGVSLGGIVAAGNNSSTSIAAILDALRIALPGAKLAGVTIEELIALTGLFRAETQRAGSEIGSTFATLFQTITNEKAQNNIKEITDGLVDVRDAEGNLRPALDILLEVKSLLDSGALDPQKMQDIFKAFAPPLNPGAAKDIAIIFDLLDQLPAALREVETSGEGALNGLVDKLNAALGPQFRILIEEAKAGFFELFGQDIVNAGQSVIDLVRGIGSILGTLPPELIRTVGTVLTLVAAFKGAAFIGGSLASLLGVGGLVASLQGTATAATAAGTQIGFMSSVAAGAVAIFSRFLPLLAAIVALDFAGNVGRQQEQLRGQIGGMTTGLDREGLLALRERLSGQMADPNVSARATNPIGFIFDEDARNSLLQGGLADPAIADGIKEIDRLLGVLDERGAGATVTMDDLGESFTGASDASQTIEEAIAGQTAEMERLMEQYGLAADAASAMTAQQQLEAETAQLLEATRENQADDLLELAERYREGKITAEEFAAGQNLVQQASQLAAQLVAAAGDQLSEYPILADAAAEGNETLTQRIYDLIVASGGSLGPIQQMIGSIVNLATANAAAAESMRNNPIIAYLGTARLNADGSRAAISVAGGGRRIVRASAIERARTAQQQFQGSSAADVERQMRSILDGLVHTIGGAGTPSSSFFTPSSSGGRTPRARAAPSTPDPTLFDIEDLPANQLARAIALARRLQGSIPGGNARAEDEVINIIKDAQFLRQVRGLDDQLLRKAIEELTDVEKARLEEEKRRNATQEILRNLQVNAGPLGALISAPTLFGVGGSIPAGLNADPTKGNFTVNVPIELKGLSPAKLQDMVYSIVRNAIRDGLRLQGTA